MDSKTKKYLELISEKKRIQKEIDMLDVEPTKLYKFIGYFVCTNNSLDHKDEDIKDAIEGLIENDMDAICHIFDFESKNIIWHDEIDLNRNDCTKKEIEEYFKGE